MESNAPTSQRQRRWPLLIGLALLLIPFSCAGYVRWSEANMPDREAEERIIAAGGRTQRESILPMLVQVLIDGYPWRYGEVWVVTLYGPVTADNLRDIAEFSRLLHLSLMGPVDSSGLPYLASLRQLDDLSLHDTDLTDADLAHFHGLTSLDRIYLSNNPGITLDGVKQLQKHLPGTYIVYYSKEHNAGVSPDYTTH